MIDELWFDRYIRRMGKNIAFLDYLSSEINSVAGLLYDTRAYGNTVFIAGNGGSAAMANHFAIDLNKVANEGGDAGKFKCVSLAGNVSELTAWGNDVSFEHVFASQLRILARPGDLVILVSSSGTSPNIKQAANWCWNNGVKSVLLSSRMKNEDQLPPANVRVLVDDNHYGRVEDTHAIILHVLCYAFKERAFDWREEWRS